MYNPKEHEDYGHAMPYKTVEEKNIVHGKYRDPEPIYDPKSTGKKYSDQNTMFWHNLEKYRKNKYSGKYINSSNIFDASLNMLYDLYNFI